MSDIVTDRKQVMDEYDVRRWFMTADLEQAQDTFRVVEGILQAREYGTPKRKRRSDAGQPRLFGAPGHAHD